MRDSTGEVMVYNVLTDAGLPFQEEYEFPDLVVVKDATPLRFDFAVFNDDGSLDFLIEYNGMQHYRPVKQYGGISGLRRQQFNDAEKRKYCARNGYTLVVIPYWQQAKIDYDFIMRAAGYY